MNRLRFYDATEPANLQAYRNILVTGPDQPYSANFWKPGHLVGYEHTFIATLGDFLQNLATKRAFPSRILTMRVRTQAVLEAVEASACRQELGQTTLVTKLTSVTCRNLRICLALNAGMLHSLLLSNDPDTVRVVSRVFKDLEVDLDHCGETFTALSQAIEHHYDAIIIDDSMEEPHVALQKLIALPSCSTSVRIVLADP